MNLQKLITENPTINITITGQELLECGRSLIKETTESMLQRTQTEKLFTAGEVEEMFDICPATRWRWNKIGLLQGRRIGNRIYYSYSSIQALLDKKKGGRHE